MAFAYATEKVDLKIMKWLKENDFPYNKRIYLKKYIMGIWKT
jgi:hypothetical protein